MILASAYRLAGYSGLAALVTAALMGLHAIVFFNARGSTRPLLVIVAMDLVLIPMMLARPHVLTWPLLALWTWLMMRAREKDRSPPLAAALLMTLWANLHGGFVFGFLVAGAFGLEALIAGPDRMRVVRQWGLFGLACALAACVNGNGIAGVVHPLHFTNLEMLPFIDEWKPSSPKVTPAFFIVLALVIGLVAWKRPRLHPVRWALLAALLGLALLQVRHQTTLAIVAAMLLPPGFAGRARAGKLDRTVIAVAVAAAAMLVAVRALLPIHPAESEANPWKMIAAVPPDLRSQPVLNGYSMGGPLILSGIRPYIDGRGDMYGDALVLGFVRISNADPGAFDAAVRRWNIRWAMLPDHERAADRAARPCRWTHIYKDKVGVIYVRPGLALEVALELACAARRPTSGSSADPTANPSASESR